MAKLTQMRERIQIEHEHVAIRLSGDDPRFVDDGWHSGHHLAGRPDENYYVLKALRLDAICKESPASSFAALLAGLRVELVVGEKPYGAMTFSRGLFRGQSLENDVDDNGNPVDLPHMQHGIVGPLGADVYLAPKQNYSVLLTYSGPRVPVSFLRVVDLGLAVRDVG